MNFNVALKHRP